MKDILPILLFILFSFSLSEDVYKCSDDLKLKTCYLSETSSDAKTTTHYVKACPKGQYCEEDLSVSYNVCIERKSLLEIGDKCITGNECITGQCTNEKCVGIAEGSKCIKDSNCDKGLYCDTNLQKKVCTKYIDEGAIVLSIIAAKQDMYALILIVLYSFQLIMEEHRTSN